MPKVCSFFRQGKGTKGKKCTGGAHPPRDATSSTAFKTVVASNTHAQGTPDRHSVQAMHDAPDRGQQVSRLSDTCVAPPQCALTDEDWDEDADENAEALPVVDKLMDSDIGPDEHDGDDVWTVGDPVPCGGGAVNAGEFVKPSKDVVLFTPTPRG
jgi:hypothetical protein